MDSYRDDEYRRRSPGSVDRRARQNRGRSRSPRNIDRYQPEGSRDRDYEYRSRDGHRRRSSPPPVQPGIDRYVPGQDSNTPKYISNPLPSPMSLDYQVGFNYFAEWWRIEQIMKEEKERAKNGGRPTLKGEREAREERGKERDQIQAAYDSYKEKHQINMSRTFVEKHKDEEWFKERYDPEYVSSFRDTLLEYRRGLYADWLRQLEEGIFDEFTLEGIYKNESNGAGGILEKEEGETTAANEVLGVGDLLPCKGGDLRDESVFQPTLLIKTIAPTVSREKVVEFCKEHLGEGAGGFKWLSLSDPNSSKKFHRMGWVILHEDNEQAPVEDRGDGREEEMEDGAVKEQVEVPHTALRTAQKAVDALDGKTVIDEVRGNFTCHVGVHEPPAAPRKKALWDLFSAPERIERDLELAKRLVVKKDEELRRAEEVWENPDAYNGVAEIEKRVEDLQSKGWLQPPANAPPTTKKKAPEDLEEGEDEVMEDGEEGLEEDDTDDEELLTKKKQLDLLIEYLRRVYNFCFFCVFESDSVQELTRKCAGGHLRRPRSSLTTAAKATAKATSNGQPFPFKKQDGSGENDVADGNAEGKKGPKVSGRTQLQLQRAYNWVKTYEDKLLQILEPDNVDLKKLGGRPTEEAIEEELNRFVKQEDESKWRCKVPNCTKLFKGQHFWRKHVEKRHEEWFEGKKKEIDLINTYVLDPAHIAPSRSDANSNGHFPMGNSAATGTPRGFNLTNMATMGLGNNGMQNAFNIQALFNPALSGANWDGPFGQDDRHGAGPIRRGGNRFNTRTGPYDRQQRDRNGRYNGSGRLTPPPRGGRGGGLRYNDGPPGPVQSTQGRSIKSYEDLDAVGTGANNSELNY